MATIRELRVSDRDAQRVVVSLEDGRTLSLPLDLAVGLRPRQVLTEAELERLGAETEFRQALTGTLALLARRPRSRAELANYLGQKKTPPRIRDRVLARLAELELLDDLAFARWWVENRREHRPRARRALAYELAQKGVPASVVAQVLSSADDGQAARDAARRFRGQRPIDDPARFARRLYAHLVRRGFDPATARRTVEDLLRESDIDADISPS